MRHNWCIEEGYFVCAKVENVPLIFLVDTGSNVSILNRSVYGKLSAEACNLVQSTNKKLLTVTGETTPFISQAVLNLEIGAQSLPINILFADIEGGGGLNAFYWYQISALDSAVVEVQEMFSSHGGHLTMQCIIMEKHSNQINTHDKTKKKACDSQIVRAKEKPHIEPLWVQLQIRFRT